MNIRNTFNGVGLKLLVASFFTVISAYGQNRVEIALTENWKFYRGKNDKAFEKTYDDRAWKTVKVPHDWAISGPI